jgi:hypothetical protein
MAYHQSHTTNPNAQGSMHQAQAMTKEEPTRGSTIMHNASMGFATIGIYKNQIITPID